MREVFNTVLSLTVSGSLLVLFLNLVWPTLAKRMSKCWLYYIWLLVVIRLLVPYSPEFSVVGTIVTQIQEYSFAKILNSSQNQLNESQVPGEKQTDDEGWVKKDPETNGDKAPDKETEPKEPIVLGKQNQTNNRFLVHMSQNLWIVWIMTALIIWIRKITIYQSFVKYIHAGWEEVEDIHQLELFGKLVEQSQIRVMVKLYTNPLVSSPLLLGFFRPCVVLPSAKVSDSDFHYTILHELSHYKRSDMFYKWLVQFTICVHWFNPLVYKMAKRINQLCELACDETVIQFFSLGEKRAYGATLLHAAQSKGKYKETMSSLTLSESMERLKERLDAIMAYKKQNRSRKMLSIILTMLLCLGTIAVGVYAEPKQNSGNEQGILGEQETTTADNSVKDVSHGSNTVANSQDEETASSTTNITAETDTASVSKPHIEEKSKSSTANRSKSFQQEYTITELKELKISGVVAEVSTEHITIVRGGSTLRFEADTSSLKAYQIRREDDGGKTRYNLCLTSSTSSSAKAGQKITITIPEKLDLKVIKAVTKSGNIVFNNCSTSLILYAETKSGRIQVEGGRAGCYLIISTKSGDAQIIGIQLPDKNQTDYSVIFETVSGNFVYQPIDGAENECYLIDTGKKSLIEVNGKKYASGDYAIHSTSLRRIYFDSTTGSFLVWDHSRGKYTFTAIGETKQNKAAASASKQQANQVAVTGRSYRKVYSLADLKKLGVTGLQIEAVKENIVVKQGGHALVIQYQQPKNAETMLGTRTYELYNGEFTKPEDIALFGGRSGTVKQLVLRRPKSELLEGTITVTLPADPRYSRVVQLSTKSGNISLSQCTSTSMLDAATAGGNIMVDKCTSPILGVKSTSGDIHVSQCNMQQLNSQTTSGSCNFQLADKASTYKMIIDTGKKANICINEKKYQGGEWRLNSNASKEILFDTKSGSLHISDI